MRLLALGALGAVEAGVVTLAAYGFGARLYRLLRRASPDSVHPIARVAIACLLGYGTLMTVFLVCSIFGVLRMPVAWGILLIGVGLVAPDSVRGVQVAISYVRLFGASLRSSIMPLSIRIAKGILLAWALFYVAQLFSASFWSQDGLYYHMPFAAELTQGPLHSPVLADVHYGYLPIGAEVFYAGLLAAFQDIFVTRFVQYAAIVLLFLVGFAFVRQHAKGSWIPYVFAALFLSLIPLQKNGLAGGGVDAFTFAFGMVSTFLLVHFLWRPQERHTLVVSALLLGCALATKYYALFFFAIHGCLLLYAWARRRVRFSQLLMYAAVSCLIAGYWYVRNAVLLHNPVFPIFSDADFEGAVNQFAVPRDFFHLVLFPFYIMGPGAIARLPFAALVAAYYSALLVLIARLRWEGKRLAGPAGLMVCFSGVFAALLFFWSHQIRFFVPVLLGMFVSMCVVVAQTRWVRLVSPAVVLCICLFLFGASVQAFMPETRCLVGDSATVQACLLRSAGSIALLAPHINTHLTHERILYYGNPLAQTVVRADNHLEDRVCFSATDDTALSACLRDEDIRYFVEEDHLERGMRDQIAQGRVPASHRQYDAKFRITAFMRAHSEQITAVWDPTRESVVHLYRLLPL